MQSRKTLTFLIVLTFVTLFQTPNLHATDIVIDFSNVGLGGGTIKGVGCTTNTCANATGTNIVINFLDAIIGNTETTYAVNAFLSFDTAANFIKIVGSIPTLGITNNTLLTGSFSSWAITKLPTTLVVSGSGPDTKSNILLQQLGLVPGAQSFNFFGFSIAAQGSGNNYTPYSTAIDNSATTITPEPMAYLLFGSGMLSMMGAHMFRTRRVRSE